jgi:hypothetical protein
LHGFLFSGGTYTTLEDPVGTDIFSAQGINDQGHIVAYNLSLGFRLDSGGTYTILYDGSAYGGTRAYGINASDQIVGYYFDSNGLHHGFLASVVLPPPAATTADMILRRGSDGVYEIYNIGNNAILAGYTLGQVGTEYQFAGLGNFSGSDTADMLLRSATTGAFEVYDISNNLITSAASLGTVGLEWQVMGFGNFSSRGETDMMLRNVNTGGLQIYNINNNQVIGSAFMGAVGLDWQFSGVGNFSSRGESDMLLRNSNTGGLEVYDIANNAVTNAAFIGTIGLDWQFSGGGQFQRDRGRDRSPLAQRQYRRARNLQHQQQPTHRRGFYRHGGIGLAVRGHRPVHAPGASDLVLRNINTGAFEVYDIAGNQLIGAASLGQVGLDWQLGGFAADAQTGSMGGSGSTSQLVQAMAAFGGGPADGLNTLPVPSETSQQTLLTSPAHA